jgi:hypothetical protein
MVPGGIRMGSPALTSRGFIESDFEQVAELVHRGIQIAKTLKGKSGARQLLPSLLSFLPREPPHTTPPHHEPSLKLVDMKRALILRTFQV